MLKKFDLTCPTKEKTVSLIVNYIDASTNEDKVPVYLKGRIRSCTGKTFNCNNCELYKTLPKQI